MRGKVVQLISSSGMYGAERWVLALLNHMQTFPSELWTFDNDSESVHQAALGQGSLSRRLSKAPHSTWLTALRHALKEENVAVLHTHGYRADVIGRAASLGLPTRCISTPHGWEKNAGLKVEFYQVLDQLSLAWMDRVCPLSEDLKRSLKFTKQAKIQVIRNFVDLSDLPDLPKDDSHFGMVYIGQLIARKRVDLILQAFARFLQHEPNAKTKLTIIGDGELAGSLRQLAQSLDLGPHILFTGYIENRLEIAARCYLSILASEREGIPRALMETMALGVCPLSSNLPGCQELIVPGESGLLFATGNVQQLSENMLEQYRDWERCAQLGRQARQRIFEEFSAATAAREYEKVYESLLTSY